MSKPTIEEQIEALAVLREVAKRNQAEIRVVEAFNTLDDGDVFAALDEKSAAVCSYQVGGSYLTPPEYCELDIEPGQEYCPKHQRLADLDSQIPDPEKDQS